MLDVQQAMRIAPEKTNHAVLRVHGDAIAVCVLLGRRDDRSHRNVFDFADSLESVANLSPFDRKLMFVANVLVSASPAPAEVGTLWFHTIRRVLLYFDQLRFGELLFLAHDLGGNDLAFDGVRNEHGLPLLASDAFPAESNVFDFQIDNAHATNSREACTILRWRVRWRLPSFQA